MGGLYKIMKKMKPDERLMFLSKFMKDIYVPHEKCESDFERWLSYVELYEEMEWFLERLKMPLSLLDNFSPYPSQEALQTHRKSIKVWWRKQY